MKIRIDFDASVPDGFKCKSCYALTKTETTFKKTRICSYFNCTVFANSHGDLIKCPLCIAACVEAHKE